MLKVAEATWEWEVIVFCDDILDDAKLPVLNYFNFTELRLELQTRLGKKKFNQVYVCKLNVRTEKVILESYPSAKVVLYEDGLHSYVPYPVYKRSFVQDIKDLFKLSWVAKLFPRRFPIDFLNNGRIYTRQTSRLQRTYLSLCKEISVPDYMKTSEIKEIQSSSLTFVLKRISSSIFDHLDDTFLTSEIPTILVLGQCFSLWNVMSWEEELEVYCEIFKKLGNCNSRIIWKEHPRMKQPFFETITSRFKNLDIRLFPFHYSWPVEIFFERMNIIGCISLTSTTLFYSKYKFGIPAFTSIQSVGERLRKDHLFMAQMVTNYISTTSSPELLSKLH